MNALMIALAMIKNFEGLRLKPYQDTAGNWTIGFGCRTSPTGVPVTADTPPLDYDTAVLWQEAALGKVAAQVDHLVTVPITDNQKAALYSLAYNIGCGRFGESTLLRELNAGKPTTAMLHFMDWVLVDGKVSTDLIRRRHAEQALFRTDLPLSATPAAPGRPAPAAPQTADDLNAAELAKVQPPSA